MDGFQQSEDELNRYNLAPDFLDKKKKTNITEQVFTEKLTSIVGKSFPKSRIEKIIDGIKIDMERNVTLPTSVESIQKNYKAIKLFNQSVADEGTDENEPVLEIEELKKELEKAGVNNEIMDLIKKARASQPDEDDTEEDELEDDESVSEEDTEDEQTETEEEEEEEDDDDDTEEDDDDDDNINENGDMEKIKN